MAQITTKPNTHVPYTAAAPAPEITVNRKKAKRRAKAAEAAARQAEEFHARAVTNGNGHAFESHDAHHDDTANEEEYAASYTYSDDEETDDYVVDEGSHPNGSMHGYLPTTPDFRTTRQKEQKGQQSDLRHPLRIPSNPPPGANAPMTMSKEKIWNTSSQEERERIKAFWLSLGEDDRKNLVRVEKDAVLKKMKEQQRHSCSCTVCGRKRVAIEEELEVLYDAYYDELETYANRQGSGPPPMLSGSRRFGQISGLQPPNRMPPSFQGPRPSRGRITEHFDDDDDEGDEDYSDDPDADYSEEDEVAQYSGHASDFFNFGQSLTVKGGILTVADDLLKNDGKKFIEMMEQLAERRMAREEDAREQYTNGHAHPTDMILPHNHSHAAHNHSPPPDDDDEYDSQEEDEEYDEDEEDYEEEEPESMTEEQRMEEGRRMFQIFAARMFEQRVLSAYKEKVAAERQYKLIQEEDEEAQNAEARKAKKARDAAKKKEKAQAKKQAVAEEKARKDAERIAQETAAKEAETRKLEEQRQKAEEKRKRREAQKKAEEEEKLRKEVEKQKRLQEQRERELEQQRKAKEAKEREREKKELARLKEKEAKEKEAREKKERAERDRKASEARAKQPPPAVPTQIIKRPPPQQPVPVQPALPNPQTPTSPQSANIAPLIPKITTSLKQPATAVKEAPFHPQTPQYGSNTSSNASPHPTTPQQNSPAPSQQGRASSQSFLFQPQAMSPLSGPLKSGPFQAGPMPPTMPMNGFSSHTSIGQPYGGRMPYEPLLPFQQQYKPVSLPSLHGPMQQGRGFPAQHGPPGFHGQLSHGMMPHFGGIGEGSASPHSRQQSGSFERSTSEAPSPAAQPIARPGPIGRPPSTSGQPRSFIGHKNENDIGEMTSHLGSSALLDDSDKPLTNPRQSRRASAAPGGMSRPGLPLPMSYSMETQALGMSPNYGGAGWGIPPPSNSAFGASSLPGSNYMGGWPNPGNFNALNVSSLGMNTRSSQPRSVAVRLMLCSACKMLAGSTPDGYYSLRAVRSQIENMCGPQEYGVISDKELYDLCETEGSPHNGGGNFHVKDDPEDGLLIKYDSDDSVAASNRALGPLGEIGSPVAGTRSVRPFGSIAGGIGSGQMRQ